MNKIEIVTLSERVELPRTDTPTGLVHGLETTVRNGITEFFDDVAWVHYLGPGELLALASDPDYRALIARAQELDTDESELESMPDIPDLPNIKKPSNYSLARSLITREGSTLLDGYGGFDHVASMRYVALPAHHVEDHWLGNTVDVEVDLANGICFDGQSLVSAMIKDGFPMKLAGERVMPEVFTQKQFGQFFVDHVLR